MLPRRASPVPPSSRASFVCFLKLFPLFPPLFRYQQRIDRAQPALRVGAEEEEEEDGEEDAFCD